MSAARIAKEIRAVTAVINGLTVSPTAHLAVFMPQPYPLFLADWSDGKPLVGRIVGWSTGPGKVPEPVVVFEDEGSTSLLLKVNMVLGMGGGGPMWIRNTAQDALAAAKAYTPPARNGAGR